MVCALVPGVAVVSVLWYDGGRGARGWASECRINGTGAKETQPRPCPVFPAAISRFVRVFVVFGGQQVGYVP